MKTNESRRVGHSVSGRNYEEPFSLETSLRERLELLPLGIGREDIAKLTELRGLVRMVEEANDSTALSYFSMEPVELGEQLVVYGQARKAGKSHVEAMGAISKHYHAYTATPAAERGEEEYRAA